MEQRILRQDLKMRPINTFDSLLIESWMNESSAMNPLGDTSVLELRLVRKEVIASLSPDAPEKLNRSVLPRPLFSVSNFCYKHSINKVRETRGKKGAIYKKKTYLYFVKKIEWVVEVARVHASKVGALEKSNFTCVRIIVNVKEKDKF